MRIGILGKEEGDHDSHPIPSQIQTFGIHPIEEIEVFSILLRVISTYYELLFERKLEISREQSLIWKKKSENPTRIQYDNGKWKIVIPVSYTDFRANIGPQMKPF
jgi:hypothetical protein